MQHTREAMKRNRGLVVIILALCVVYMIEPTLGFLSGACRDLLLMMGNGK